MTSSSAAFAIAMSALLAVPSFAREKDPQRVEDELLAVFIGDSSQADESSFILEAILTHMGDFQVRLESRWLDNLPNGLEAQKETASAILGKTGANAVIWCDFYSDQRNIYFYMPSAQGKNVVVRTIDTTDRAVAAETFAVIVRAWMTTLLAQEVESSDPALPPGNAPTAKRSPDSEVPPKLVRSEELPSEEPVHGGLISLEAAYLIGFVSSEQLTMQGASVAVGLRFLRYWQLVASYQFVQPIEATWAGVHVKLRRHPFWLQGRFTYRARRMAVGGGLALGADYATEEHRSEIAIGEDSAEVHISVVPMFVFSTRLVSELRAFIHLGAEIFLSQARYVVLTGEGEQEVLKPWPVQPIGLAGLSFEFF